MRVIQIDSLLLITQAFFATVTLAFVPPLPTTSVFSLYPSQIHQTHTNDNENGYDDDDDGMSIEERKKFDEIAERFLNVDQGTTDFPSALPINPFKSSIGGGFDGTGGKSSLYSDDELFRVLTLHNELSEEMNGESDDGSDDDGANVPLEGTSAGSQVMGGIHDLVINTLNQKVDDLDLPVSSRSAAFLGSIPTPEMNMEIDEEIQRRTTQIRAIASDVDGTILTSKMTIHPRTRLAITKAIKMAASSLDGDEDDNSNEKIQHFFPATGKSRKGALDSLGIEIGSLIEEHCGGVYLQGLFCVDPSGTVVYEQKLDREAIDATESLVEDSGISIVGYDGDDLYTTDQTEIVIHLHEHYGEPLPVLLPTNQDEEELPSTRKLCTHEPSMHKLLLMDDDTDKLANVVRPKLEALAEKYNASVTQALPTMLELLPQGCSKALGVTKLCEALGINPGEELLALGDAENDAGMLDMACIGVAVGNASPPARDSSDLVIDYTNDDGGAGYAIEWFGLS